MELGKLKESLVKEFNELQQKLLELQQGISQIEVRKQRIIGQLELIDRFEKEKNEEVKDEEKKEDENG